jgi:hypothetical protein
VFTDVITFLKSHVSSSSFFFFFLVKVKFPVKLPL